MKKNKIISTFLLSAACLVINSTPHFNSVEASERPAPNQAQTTAQSARNVFALSRSLLQNNDIAGMVALLNGEVAAIEGDGGYTPSRGFGTAVANMRAAVAAAEPRVATAPPVQEADGDDAPGSPAVRSRASSVASVQEADGDDALGSPAVRSRASSVASVQERDYDAEIAALKSALRSAGPAQKKRIAAEIRGLHELQSTVASVQERDYDAPRSEASLRRRASSVASVQEEDGDDALGAPAVRSRSSSVASVERHDYAGEIAALKSALRSAPPAQKKRIAWEIRRLQELQSTVASVQEADGDDALGSPAVRSRASSVASVQEEDGDDALGQRRTELPVDRLAEAVVREDDGIVQLIVRDLRDIAQADWGADARPLQGAMVNLADEIAQADLPLLNDRTNGNRETNATRLGDAFTALMTVIGRLEMPNGETPQNMQALNEAIHNIAEVFRAASGENNNERLIAAYRRLADILQNPRAR